MKRVFISPLLFFLFFSPFTFQDAFAGHDTIPRLHKVTLPEAHTGDPETDIRLLDSYGRLAENIRAFYLEARAVFSENADAHFSDSAIIAAARKHNLPLMGGPMLGRLSEDGVVIWLRPSVSASFQIKVISSDGSDEKTYRTGRADPGVVQRINLDGLAPDTEYNYTIHINKKRIAEGRFKTAPFTGDKGLFRLAFGSCFHKIGLHNPNLIGQILEREPHAMMLLGDIAVDDREDRINMHRSDYLLRDVSGAWQKLAANIPLYTSWDDHDYLNNDLSGVPERFTSEDREALREVWQQNWNNPQHEGSGIWFNTRVGPLEIIMPDTRSCRENDRRGEYGSYLGKEQLDWLKRTLRNSDAPFKVISGGTMWSDYISNGKDSWGTWDTIARNEIFSIIAKENIEGVLLISGDRHGARGFEIPGPSGGVLYEFEAASLGGVPGPAAYAKDTTHQLFGYHGTDVIAFGEFTFNTRGDHPEVIFRLIDERGHILEEHKISLR